MALSGQDWFELGFAAFLVLLNGFFVAAEFALVKVRPTQVEAMRNAGDPRAGLAQHILDHVDGYLSACQLGITAASLGLGWVAEAAVAELIEPPLAGLGVTSAGLVHTLSFVLAFAAITFAHVVVGEQAPKSLAIRHPVSTTRFIVRPLAVFYYASWPFMKVLNSSALLLLRALRIPPTSPTQALHSEEELESLVNQMGEGQGSSRLAREILANVFELRRLTPRQVMVHRTRVVALNLGEPLAENLRRARESGFSRFPIVRGSLDNVVGIVHLKDLAFLDDKNEPDVLETLAQPAVLVPETAPLDSALLTLLDAKAKIAIVADEHGGTEGIVTVEDILEELVGEIEDAFEEKPPPYVALQDGGFAVRGDASLHDLWEILPLSTEDTDVTTIGGLLVKALGHVPHKGEFMELSGWRITATDATRRRVREILLERAASREDETSPS